MAHIFCSSVNHAVHDGNIKELKKLIRKRKRVDVQDNLGWSPLHIAARKNRGDIVTVLLNHRGTEVNCRNHEGYTSLLLACDLPNLDIDIATDLLVYGADPNIPNNEDVGPIHLACKHKNLELVNLLVLHHASVNSQDFNGYTPLHCAVESDSPELVEYLLAHNADANLTETHGLNVLMFTLHLQRNLFELLLPYTRNLDALTQDGWTALLFAIKSSNLSAVRALMERGASLTAQKCNYSTLQLAATARNFDVFKLIWQHTDLDVVSQNGDFLRFVCTYCSIPRYYRHYELILNADDVYLHVNGATGIFYDLFGSEPTIDVNFETAKSQFLNVIGWLLDKNVHLRMNDVEQMLWYFKECQYTTELWQMIFTKTTPDITEHIVTNAIKYENYDLALLLLTYCLHLTPENVLDFHNEIDDTFCRNWLALFTPTSQYRQTITHHSCWFMNDSAIKILNKTKPVKSLLELSRDTVREAMQDSCNTTQDFLVALDILPLPTYLKDVLRLRIPVNRYLFEN